MSQEDPTEVSSWVESYYQLEEEVAKLLDEVRDLQLQNEYRAAQERIGTFYEARSNAFKAVYYSLVGTEAFFNDVAQDVNEEAAADLQELSEEYSDLTSDFEVVSASQDTLKQAPISGGAFRRKYDSEVREPLIEYTLYSGSMPVLEATETVGETIATSRLFVEAAGASIEQTTENSLPLSDDESEEITKATERLISSVRELEDLIEPLSGDTSESVSKEDT